VRIAFGMVAAAWLTLGGAAVASATIPPDRPVTLVTPGSTNADVTALAITADGSRVFFSTTESLVPADTDHALDIYEQDRTGPPRLVSAGTQDLPATYRGVSSDGTRVWYETGERIAGTTDTDSSIDVYEHAPDGSTRLISAGVGEYYEGWLGASADGTRVWYGTAEPLSGTGDRDSSYDVYERDADGTTRLVSAGTASFDAFFRGSSTDGSRVFYSTAEALAPADTDTGVDVYERDGDGTNHLVTVGSTNADELLWRVSPDGRTVWFATSEAIRGTGDVDTATDVYARKADGTTHLVSGGTAGYDALFRGYAAGGDKVFFETSESLVPADTNGVTDVYVHDADGLDRLVSPGTQAGPVYFNGSTTDGTRVWLFTYVSLDAADTDTAIDIYERTPAGALVLITAGTPTGGTQFAGASPDGLHVRFLATAAIPGTGDTDTFGDTYERDASGAVRLLTPGTPNADAYSSGASLDGSRIIWTSPEQAAPGDTDLGVDIFETAWAAPTVTTPASLAGPLAVGQASTCTPGAIAGEGVTTTITWIRDATTVATGTTYTPSRADAGHAIRCRTTGASVIGTASTDSTALTVAPFVLAAARITGTTRVGKTVICAARLLGSRSPIRYAWLRGARAIRGATRARYRLTVVDRRASLRCTVTAVNAAATVTTTSPARRVR
jgi:Tol biopolymer transport system component